MAAMVVMMMAGDNTKTTTTSDLNPPEASVFHDFLGSKTATSSSEKQVDSHFERVSYYAPKTDLSVSEISNQFAGSKRNHSDSALLGSFGEGVPQITPQNSHVMKMLCNASGRERPRILHYGEPLHGAHKIPPVTAAFMSQQTANPYAKIMKPERSNPMNIGGGSMQYNAYAGHTSPIAYQVPTSRFRDGGSGPSVMTHMAADEGSRTGKKGSGILKSINPGSYLVSERNSSDLLPIGYNVKPPTCNSEPESSKSPSRRGLTSSSRQMTIIFGGQLHVFDDVHPDKADVIMSLARSDGGSWSTKLSKSSVWEPTNNNCLPTRANVTSTTSGSLPQKHHNIIGGGNSIHGLGFSKGGKAAGTSCQAADSLLEAKQEI